MKNTVDIKQHIRSLSKKAFAGNQLEIESKSSEIRHNIGLVGNKFNPKRKNNSKFYPLSLSSWDYEEKKAILEQLEIGEYTMGEKVELFERKFADYFNSKYALMVNSGSSANLLIIAALVLSPKYNFNSGDEVIVPAVGWSTSYSPFYNYGIKLRFVDIDPMTLNIDENKIEDAITSKTRAILGINILGNPIEFKRIQEICKNNNLILIEDNCESLGASYNSKYCGTFGLAGSHSFFFSHHIQTIEGGMITTDEKEIFEYLKCIRAHGWTRDLSYDSKLKNSTGEKFRDSYRFVLPGYNLRPNELNAAVGLCQLRKFESFLKIRRKNAEIFKGLFSKKPFCKIQSCGQESSWFGFSIILDGNLKNKRSHVIYELDKVGIESRPIVTGNFLKNPVKRFYDYTISNNLKNTEVIDNSGFYVGNYNKILTKELNKLFLILSELNKKYENENNKKKIN